MTPCPDASNPDPVREPRLRDAPSRDASSQEDLSRDGSRRDVPPASVRPGAASVVRRFLPLAAVAAAMLAVYLSGGHEALSLSALIRQRAALAGFVDEHLLLAGLAYLALYVAAVALSFPGAALLTVMGGFLFGWVGGGVLAALAATVGASVIFLIARSSLGRALRERAGPFVRRMAEGLREDAFNYLLVLRLAPVFPFWLVNIAPALFEMRLRPYVMATFLGILPGTFAYAFIGTGLDSVIAAQEAADPGCAAAGTCRIELSALVTGELVAAFAALALVATVPLALRKWRGRRGP